MFWLEFVPLVVVTIRIVVEESSIRIPSTVPLVRMVIVLRTVWFQVSDTLIFVFNHLSMLVAPAWDSRGSTVGAGDRESWLGSWNKPWFLDRDISSFWVWTYVNFLVPFLVNFQFSNVSIFESIHDERWTTMRRTMVIRLWKSSIAHTCIIKLRFPSVSAGDDNSPRWRVFIYSRRLW